MGYAKIGPDWGDRQSRVGGSAEPDWGIGGAGWGEEWRGRVGKNGTGKLGEAVVVGLGRLRGGGWMVGLECAGREIKTPGVSRGCTQSNTINHLTLS